MKVKTILIILVMLAVATLIMWKAGWLPRSQPKVNSVRIAYLPSSSCLPLFVALEKGYFQDAGIDVQTLRFTATNDALNAVLAGRADGTPGFGLSSFCAIEAKAPGAIRVYLPCVEDQRNYANKILVPAGSPIKSIQQLNGKRIGTYTSSTQLLYLQLMMKNALPPGGRWKIVQVDEKLQLQALSSGQFDALFTVEPNGTRAVSEGIARVLVENPRCKYMFTPFPAGANCLSSSFVRSKPELAAKVAKVFVRAARFIQQNPDAARAILPRYTPVDRKVADRVGLYTWCLPGEEDYASLQRLADLLHRQGLLEKTVKIKDMWYSLPKH